MPPTPAPRSWAQFSPLFARLVVLLGGIIAGQTILYGPALFGFKILLPLDVLATPNVLLPATPQTARIVPHDMVLSDLIYTFEPARRFAVSEMHAGRFPLWHSYEYAGAPFVYPKYSPFWLPQICIASPVIIAWAQVLIALVAGTGMYVFCRRCLAVSFWPATIAAWNYPLVGSFVLWQGYPIVMVIAWLPWILWATDRTIRQPTGRNAAALALVTGFAILGGHIDVAGQVLLVSGFYAIWCLLNQFGMQWLTRRAIRSVLVVTLAWGLGFLLAAPDLLPLLEYTHTGARMERRSKGVEERPPVGISALPQVVLPDVYGSTQHGSLFLASGNLLESTAQTYAGLLATLLVAPLAWCSRRHRSSNVLWMVIGFVALSWSLDVPGLVGLLRLPVLNMMSHNRFVFATSFALLAMTAVGLEVLCQANLPRRWWFALPAGLLAGLLVWCLYRAYVPAEPIATQLADAINRGMVVGWIHNLADVELVQATFARSFSAAALLCALGVGGWLLLWLRVPLRPWFVPVLGMVLAADLLWFGYGRSAQCDPALYYPRIPILQQLAHAPVSGRVIGYNCLPAALASTQGLRDIRGYDGVDPARLMDILSFATDPHSPVIPYAMTQWLVPKAEPQPPSGVRLSPIMDLLNVRYVILRGSPPGDFHPALAGDDYWILTNENALPRVFVPQQVEVVADAATRLQKLGDASFNPRQVAYVESPVSLPPACRGAARIVDEIPSQIDIALAMETPGLAVLSDLWDPGWHAYLNGQPVAILRTDHALRGVVVPAGAGTLQLRYEPASLALGCRICGLAALALLLWCGLEAIVARRQTGNRA